MRQLIKSTVLLRLLLAVIFLYASYDKILDPESFAISVQNYQLIPMTLTNLVAIVLPWLEFYCGLFLLIGWWHRAAALLVSIMNVIFIVALSLSWMRGLDIECGCFGTGNPVNAFRILEDILLLGFSLLVYFKPDSDFTLENLYIRIKNSAL